LIRVSLNEFDECSQNTTASIADFDALVASLRGNEEHWETLPKLKIALGREDYEVAHEVFVNFYSDPVHGQFLKERAFFWLYWAKVQEQFSMFDRAADLYQQAIEHRAQVRFNWIALIMNVKIVIRFFS